MQQINFIVKKKRKKQEARVFPPIPEVTVRSILAGKIFANIDG